MWKKLDQFLERFNNFKLPKEKEISDVVEAVYNQIGIKLENTDISVNNSIAYIQTDPIVRNEIFFKKQEILNELHQKLFSSIKDIR